MSLVSLQPSLKRTETWAENRMANQTANQNLHRVIDFDASELATRKAGRTVSVCIPARNEAATIGPMVSAIRRQLSERVSLIDEILVIDDRSTDDTAAIAKRSGALVVSSSDVLAEFGDSCGKGDALWRSLAVSSGDIVVWCDGDLQRFDPSLIVGLIGPLIEQPELAMSKGYFRRVSDDGVAIGGRVTELVARPMLSLLFAQHEPLREPLSGMCAIRRNVAERIPFESDYGVDIGIVLDVIAGWGRCSLAEVDLGQIRHRNHALDVLGPQATAVARAVLSRAGFRRSDLGTQLKRISLPSVDMPAPLRPPLASVRRLPATIGLS